ncbi:MAG: discoidin domain-containing protein [Chitinophagaceae bacterium]
MRNTYITVICALLVLFAACKKDAERTPLPEGSVSLQLAADKDTIEMPLSILKDSVIVLGLKATLTGTTSPSDHWVSFSVDTTKITDYRSRFGNALLLPSTAYLFYKSTSLIPAGASVSDSAQLNIGQQTKLTEYSTYVLPVKIHSVDGNTEGTATDRVVYFVFKTGKPLFINKTGWTIAGNSSQQGTFAPTNLLDANTTTTYWASNITQQLPQWVAINFNRNILFTAVNYSLPSALNYPNLGGFPTSVKIETSMNGTDWEDKGTFARNMATSLQTLNTGEVTARYLRFTALAGVKYASAYDAVFISDISLLP